MLDTPGHADFFEDTYRSIRAADAAVMALDASKGVESQSLALVHACREHSVPVVTFVNKCDRPTLPAPELFDRIAGALELAPTDVMAGWRHGGALRDP